jgi:hypothetical protein
MAGEDWDQGHEGTSRDCYANHLSHATQGSSSVAHYEFAQVGLARLACRERPMERGRRTLVRREAIQQAVAAGAFEIGLRTAAIRAT